jgi:processive 1,2-diacylglycerol beta-glucosyltransferase
MDVSDVLITKPGGMTCTEAMAKGLPMLFIPPHPGQEEENCEYFVQAGHGRIIDSADVITNYFQKLCDEQQQGTTPPRRNDQTEQAAAYDPTLCAQAVHDLLFPATTEVTAPSLERFKAGITARPLSGTRLPL